MKKILLILIFITLASVFHVRTVYAAAPTGYLDLANDNTIAGWAKDDDFTGAIGIHIYVDGVPVKAMSADGYRADVGHHAFQWNHASFGSGNHEVRVYAIGVNTSGQLDTINPEINGSPKTISVTSTPPAQSEYSLTSGNVKVVFDSKFGGTITKIYDYANMGNLNVVDDSQGGAMFQTAFWILPYHNYNPPYITGNPSLPPECNVDTPDKHLDNPTQAGFVADGLLGNPIGVFGTSTTQDPAEFIRYEDNNQTIHFKSRFIRYDYCQSGGATMDKRQWWDTDFYIEQWASFRKDLPDTLTLKSKIIYTGNNPKSVTTRQLPVIFARHLPRVGYWKNGQKMISSGNGGIGINPDRNWAALIAGDKETGIGMVASPGMTAMLNKDKFMYGEFPDGTENTNTLFISGGVPDLRNTGILTNINYDAPSGHVFTFNPGGTFEWTTFYPIGQLSMIKQNAESLLSNYSNFGMTTPTSAPTPTPTPASLPGDLNLQHPCCQFRQAVHHF